MRYLLELDKENLQLSKAEVKSLIKCEHPYLINNYLLFESNNKEIEFLSKRLALTRRIFKILILCSEKNLVHYLKKYDWQKIYKKDFSIKLEYKSKYEERILAYHIWNNVKKPKVNLKTPSTPIHLFKIKHRIFVTKLEKTIQHNYLDRKAHNRPKNHPSSLHPKLAKALINLTGIKKGTLVDPMCGAGGFLLETSLMNLKTIGYDISEEMIERSKKNLNYFKIKKHKLIHKDFLKVNKKIDYLVCDLPYGRNTSKKGLSNLYKNFLKKIKKQLQKKAVIIFPKNHDKLIKDSKLKIDNKFEVYIHKSLTRVIYVITKD